MKSRRLQVWSGLALFTALGSAICALPAHAQGPEDGPPPGQGPQGGPPPPGGGPGGPGGNFGPGGPGGPGMRGMNRPPMTALHIPVAVLDAELKLTSAQKEKIAQAQKQFMQQARPTPPGQDGPQGGPPDPEAMRARMDKIRSLDQSMGKQIEATLTASQKQALPALYKTLDAMRAAQIPLEVYGDLHLTAEQKQQLAALNARPAQDNSSRQQAGDQARRSGQFGATSALGGQPNQQHEKAMALLTSDQRKVVEAFRQKQPRPQGGPGFGPPDGQGGPGGPDMPPPPPGGRGGDDGQGGPPPPPTE